MIKTLLLGAFILISSCSMKNERMPASANTDQISCMDLVLKLSRLPEELDYLPSKRRNYLWQYPVRDLFEHLFGNVGDRMLRKLGPDYKTLFKGKDVISLSNYNLSARELKHLNDFIDWDQIKRLDFSKNMLLSESTIIEYLKKMPNLEHLNLLLTGTGKSHKIVEALSAHRQLKRITLHDISYNDLLKLTSEHNKLTQIDLRNSGLTTAQLLKFLESGNASKINKLIIPKFKTNHAENILDTTAKEMKIRLQKTLTIRAVYDEMNPRSVYDGDTIKLDLPIDYIGNDMEIRLAGIDAAEMKTDDPFEKQVATAAKHFVTYMLSNAKRLEVRGADKGKYFRFVGDVYADGVSISDQLIAKKLVVPYDGNTKTIVNWRRFYRDNRNVVDYWNQAQFWD